MIFVQLAVLLICIFIGARMSGIGLGVMGMIGLLIFLFVGGGVFAPFWLLALGRPTGAAGAVLLILLGALLVRAEIVRLPHLVGRASGHGS